MRNDCGVIRVPTFTELLGKRVSKLLRVGVLRDGKAANLLKLAEGLIRLRVQLLQHLEGNIVEGAIRELLE